MSLISFQPAFDVFHTEFRFLRLRRIMTAENPWHLDQLRIADFYLLFFFRIQDVRLSPRHRSMKKRSQQYSFSRYERQPDDQLLFARMEGVQRAAFETLVSKGFFDADSFVTGFVVDTNLPEPLEISNRIDEINSGQSSLMEDLSGLIEGYPLLGPDGLKSRTQLLEHRYDISSP